MATAQKPQTEQEEIVSRVAAEVWNEGNLEVVDEFFTEESIAHFPGIDAIQGPDEYKEHVRQYHTAFPDFHVELTELFSDAEDDRVVARYDMTGTNDGPLQGGAMEIPPTGKSVEIDGIVVIRFEDGTVVEETNRSDSLRMLEQLGLVG